MSILVSLSTKGIYLHLLLVIVIPTKQFNCDTHTAYHPIYTNHNVMDYMSSAFIQKTLFARNTSMPKKYVVAFKYDADAYSRVITGARISTNVEGSSGDFQFENGHEITDSRYAWANIHIPSTESFTVDVEMRGYMGMSRTGFGRWLNTKEFRPRHSSALYVCATEQPKTQYRRFEFGKRRDGDGLLHFEKELISPTDNRRPRHTIQYSNPNVTLTSVSIGVNSTKAMLFGNRVTLKENEFLATIYGLNRDTFAAVWFVYGFIL